VCGKFSNSEYNYKNFLININIQIILILMKYYEDNLMIVGDSAGFLTTARLKGVHLAIRSGICAAQTAVEAFDKNDTSKSVLSKYEELVNNSPIYKEMYPIRNMRAVMQEGMVLGGLKMGVQLVTGGTCLFVPEVKADCDTTKKVAMFTGVPFRKRFADKLDFDKKLTFDKVTSVYYSKAMHDEVQPVHLVVNDPEQFQKSNIEEVKARGGRILTVATVGDTEIAEISEEVIYVPEIDEHFFIHLTLFQYFKK
jgi:electron-transferring-flavoprotein dehydrogenase